jgi:hypothetical protein
MQSVKSRVHRRVEIEYQTREIRLTAFYCRERPCAAPSAGSGTVGGRSGTYLLERAFKTFPLQSIGKAALLFCKGHAPVSRLLA